MRKRMKPSKAIDPAAIVKEVWGLDLVSHNELESYDDRNYLCVVRNTNGLDIRYTLKVHNGVESMHKARLSVRLRLGFRVRVRVLGLL